MASISLKYELADHIYQYLCHEAQYSDLPEAAKESLTAASECIEQAYKLNVNNNPSNVKQHLDSSRSAASSILPDELLRIFTRHKEFLSQQKDSIIYPLRHDSESSSIEKPDIRVNSHSLQTNIIDSHNSNPINSSNINQNAHNNNSNTSSVQNPGVSSSGQQQPQATTKQHSQHPISQLPMTTRKKLSHLRAQIKRQASKAARSRLEKRSSVSGVTTSSGGGSSSGGPQIGVGGHSSCNTGTTIDSNNGVGSKQSIDNYNTRELGNQAISSSTDSPNSTYLSGSTAMSPVGTCGNSGLNDTHTNSNSASGQQNESGASSSGTKQGSHLIPGSHHHSSLGASVHQKNFKQKLIALIKKFRTDVSDFDSEEQYREALERELMKAAAGRGSRAIEELLEEDIDVEGDSGSEPEDWDNISESSTPKPSLRPFFSSTTLDKI